MFMLLTTEWQTREQTESRQREGAQGGQISRVEAGVNKA